MKITRKEYNRLNKELIDTKKQLKHATMYADAYDHFVNHYWEYRAVADELSQTRAIRSKGIK